VNNPLAFHSLSPCLMRIRVLMTADPTQAEGARPLGARQINHH
jgi:hypothetical protein